MTDSQKILVIHTGGLKKFASALPFMARLHEVHKNAEITLMTVKRFVDLAGQTGYFDKIWEIMPPGRFNYAKWLALRLRAHKFGFGRIYNFGDDLPFFKAAAAPDIADDIPVSKGWCRQNIDYFNLPERYVLLAPSGKGRRGWPATRFGTIAKKLHFEGLTPVLVGTGADQELSKRIRKICPEAIDLCRQTTLAEIAGLAEQAQFTLCHYSGIGVLAGFTNGRVMCLVTPDEPTEIPGLDRGNAVIMQDDLSQTSVDDVFKTLKSKGWR